jgi:hypothetical protein
VGKTNWSGIRKDEYGMTIFDLTKIGLKDETFVLAKNVHQVFYVKDKNRRIKIPKDHKSQSDTLFFQVKE